MVFGTIMIWAKKKIDSLDPIPHHSGQTQPGEHLFIDDDDDDLMRRRIVLRMISIVVKIMMNANPS